MSPALVRQAAGEGPLLFGGEGGSEFVGVPFEPAPVELPAVALWADLCVVCRVADAFEWWAPVVVVVAGSVEVGPAAATVETAVVGTDVLLFFFAADPPQAVTATAVRSSHATTVQRMRA